MAVPAGVSDSASRILVVDDDDEIRTLLGEMLAAAQFQVSMASDGRSMHDAMAKAAVDLVVLDLNLPGEDGLSLYRQIRAAGDTPIIMLTARADPIDRIVGLEMGADDYVSKPFEPRELLARIRTVLRRLRPSPGEPSPAAAKKALFAGWTLDFEHRRLIDPSGRLVMLSGAEYALLRTFIDHANQVLTREQLVASNPGAAAEAGGRLADLQVSRLRQKLDDDARGAGLIRTVRSQGYVLAAGISFK